MRTGTRPRTSSSTSLDGELTLVEDERRHRRFAPATPPPGSAGADNAHRLENRGAADASYLVVGTRAACATASTTATTT